ncbi:MAG: ATP-binding protein [Bacteroidetes bacterium]|nr:ATP-binding protein [Bacteroidota bacterium]
MERQQFQKLINWKNSKDRKPLIIRGARQVGKTWLMQEFGKREYMQTVYINFESSKSLRSLFENDYNIQRIITALEIETDIQINSENTLIIFDEIQECDGAITSLKYFCENAPQYHVIAAGSLLGVALHSNISFPVGKVDFLDLYPLTFSEFLLAMNKKSLFDLLMSKDWEMITGFKSKFIELLRQYYFIGGMPEVVFSFSKENNFNKVREIQNRILNSYEQDFSKHAPIELVPRIRMIWNSIPAQLAKENRKFMYGLLKQGARAKEFEMAMAWLIDSGLIYKVNRCSKPAIPLIAYMDNSAFKIYILDVGLLAAIGNIDVKTIINGNQIFQEFKGAITEQFVLQQLKSIEELPIYYWSTEKSTAEIDFLVQHSDSVIPMEVKAEENLKAKSLKYFNQKYKMPISIRTSMADYRIDEWLTNLPLYAIENYWK